MDGLVDAIAKAPVCVREIVLVDQAELGELSVGQLRQLQDRGVAIRHVHCTAEATLAQRYNAGAAHVPHGLILFTNAMSCPVLGNWLSQLAGYCSLPGVGAVGPRLMDGDKVWCAGLSVLPTGLVKRDFADMPSAKFGYLYRGRIAHECVALPAEAMMTSKSAHEAVGGFPADEDDPVSIGLHYCRLLAARGLHVVNCAGVDFDKTDALDWTESIVVPRGGLVGSLTNPNLVETAGSGSAANYCAPLHGRSRTNIVFVSHNLENEGAPITLLDLVAGLLADNMINATILSPRDGPLAERYRALGAQVRIIDGLGRRAGLQEFLAYKTSLSDLYLELGASLVIVNTLEMFPAVNAAEDAGLASIWCHHESGSWHSYFRRSRRHLRAYAYAAFSEAYRVVFVAEATRRAWSVLELRRNFQVIRYGVPDARLTADLNRWRRDEARERLGLSGGEVAILLVGSVCRRKGQKDILKAAREISATSLAKLRFHVVGAFVEQRYEEEIRDEYAKMPAEVRDRIVFTGAVDDVSLYYRASDIFVLCSRQESAPRVLVEAMSFELPIVTTAVDGIPELVRPRRDALFYNPGDAGELAALLSDLANSIETVTLGSEGPARVADICDYGGMIDKFSELIAQAAAAGKNKLPMVLPAAH